MKQVPTSGKDVSNLYNLVGKQFAPGSVAADVIGERDGPVIPAGVRFDVSCHVVAQVQKDADGKVRLLGAYVSDPDSFPMDGGAVMRGGDVVEDFDLAEEVGSIADDLLADLFGSAQSLATGNEVLALLDEIVKECATGPGVQS